MVLYVVPVPDPQPGTDWQAVVPGQYLWDIVGVTAELLPLQQTPPATMTDSSGNGNNGTYGNGSVTGDTFVQGVVPDDFALRVSLNNKVGDAPLVADPVTGDFTVGFWFEPETASDFVFWGALTGSVNPTIRFSVRGNSSGNLFALDRQYAPGNSQNFRAGTLPLPLGANFAAAVFRAASTTVDFYLNGTHFTSNTQAVQTMTTTSNAVTLGASSISTFLTYDEMFLVDRALTGTDVASLYNAGLAGFTSWDNTVQALAPFALYHLNDAQFDNGRQVDFHVTDGTHTVAEIPTGFPAPTGGRPLEYGWQPNLSASTQTPDGSITTVALPDLILPAGYTIGTRTLDIGPIDQWQGVTIWWNDDFQQLTNPANFYTFPGGVRLRYQQEQHTP